MADEMEKVCLFIFTALYQEAEPLIRAYGMRQRRRVLPFQQFEDPQGRILLTITGTGPAAASAAAGAVLGCAEAETSYRRTSTDEITFRNNEENAAYDPQTEKSSVHAVLFGSAGAETENSSADGLYLGVRLQNLDSGRDFYPEPLGIQMKIGRRRGGEAEGLLPAVIRTSARLWQRKGPVCGDEKRQENRKCSRNEQGKFPDSVGKGIAGSRSCDSIRCVDSFEETCGNDREGLLVLHDMEAAAWYEAASRFLGPDKIHVLKFISDSGDTGRLTAEDVRKLAEQHMPAVRITLDEIFGRAKAEADRRDDNVTNDAGSMDTERLAEELCASATMRADVRKLYRYARLLPGDVWDREIFEKRAEGKIPCENRREGKEVLREIKQELIYGTDRLRPAHHQTCAEKWDETQLPKTEVKGAESRGEETEERGSEPLTASAQVHTGPVVYVEEEILDHPRTRRILAKLPDALVIPIRHYKDVFNRGKQDRILQRQENCLILAENTGRKVYPGAPVCQSFGNEWFYYTSSVMNCLFDCEYCYLKGMYNSGSAVIFVNLEDTFSEVESLLGEHPVYLCISYDTDLMALEALTGYVEEWMEFAACHTDLKVEIRTKSGRRDFFQKWENDRHAEKKSGTIFAYTISPEEVIRKYEHQTAPLSARLMAAKAAMEAGFPVRLCFDPMLYVPDWMEKYDRMLETVAKTIDLTKVWDISVGSFRISASYLKQMRKAEPDSLAVQFPFELTKGYYHYPEKLAEEMEQRLMKSLQRYVPEEKIFRWEEDFSSRR